MSLKLVILERAFSLSYLGRLAISGKADSGITFDHVYSDTARGRFLVGRLVDRFILNFPSLRATRARWSYISGEVLRVGEKLASADGEIKIVDIASGVSRYLVDLAQRSTPLKLRCLCLDRDAEVLSVGKRISSREAFRYHRTDVLRDTRLITFGIQKGWRPDIAIATGFVEYLDDNQLTLLFRRVHVVLREGGYLIFSSQIQNPSRHLMESICRTSKGTSWNLVYREPETISATLTNIGFSIDKMHVDDLRMYSIFTAKKIGLEGPGK